MDAPLQANSISKFKLTTYSFRLEGLKAKGKIQSIGIFSFYDSFSLIPGLSNGQGNSTLTNVIAFLHLAEKMRFLFDEMKEEQK